MYSKKLMILWIIKKLTRYDMCYWIVNMLRICKGLYEFIRDKMNTLERHIHSQLSRVTPVECKYPFFLVHVLYTIQYIPIRGIVHLQSLFNHCNKIILHEFLHFRKINHSK